LFCGDIVCSAPLLVIVIVGVICALILLVLLVFLVSTIRRRSALNLHAATASGASPHGASSERRPSFRRPTSSRTSSRKVSVNALRATGDDDAARADGAINNARRHYEQAEPRAMGTRGNLSGPRNPPAGGASAYPASAASAGDDGNASYPSYPSAATYPTRGSESSQAAYPHPASGADLYGTTPPAPRSYRQ